MEQRKNPRLSHYDYANDNYYFVTVCTYEKKCIFGAPNSLNWRGKIVHKHIENLQNHYNDVCIDKYVVMPNHIHLIIKLGCNPINKNSVNLNIVVGQLKSGISRQIRKISPNEIIWQRSYHDHIIRNQQSYEKIWLYIEANPQLWMDDCFYDPQGEIV